MKGCPLETLNCPDNQEFLDYLSDLPPEAGNSVCDMESNHVSSWLKTYFGYKVCLVPGDGYAYFHAEGVPNPLDPSDGALAIIALSDDLDDFVKKTDREGSYETEKQDGFPFLSNKDAEGIFERIVKPLSAYYPVSNQGSAPQWWHEGLYSDSIEDDFLGQASSNQHSAGMGTGNVAKGNGATPKGWKDLDELDDSEWKEWVRLRSGGAEGYR